MKVWECFYYRGRFNDSALHNELRWFWDGKILRQGVIENDPSLKKRFSNVFDEEKHPVTFEQRQKNIKEFMVDISKAIYREATWDDLRGCMTRERFHDRVLTDHKPSIGAFRKDLLIQAGLVHKPARGIAWPTIFD